MPTKAKNESTIRQPDRSKDAGDGPQDVENKGANASSVSRVESGGTGSSAGEPSLDPSRLKGE